MTNPFLEDVEVLPLADEEIWLAMWHTLAGRVNCLEPGVATAWADRGLADFQARFRREGKRCDA